MAPSLFCCSISHASIVITQRCSCKYDPLLRRVATTGKWSTHPNWGDSPHPGQSPILPSHIAQVRSPKHLERIFKRCRQLQGNRSDKKHSFQELPSLHIHVIVFKGWSVSLLGMRRLIWFSLLLKVGLPNFYFPNHMWTETQPSFEIHISLKFAMPISSHLICTKIHKLG